MCFLSLNYQLLSYKQYLQYINNIYDKQYKNIAIVVGIKPFSSTKLNLPNILPQMIENGRRSLF